jgi:hypothetical protein
MLKIFGKSSILAAALALSLNAQAGYVVQYQNSLGDSSDNKNYGNSVFLQYNTKLDDNWGFNAELLEEFLLQSVNSTDRLKITHGFFRTNFKRKNLFSFGDWSGALGIRYFFPTTATMQNQGSFGSLTFRPEMSKSFGSFSLTTMVVAGPYLQRRKSAYVGGNAGNPFWITGLRFVPSYQVNSNVYVAADFLIFNTLSFGANGEGTTGTNKIDNEIELGFKGEATANWSVGVVAHSAGTLTGENGSRVYSPKAFDYNLRFSKEF